MTEQDCLKAWRDCIAATRAALVSAAAGTRGGQRALHDAEVEEIFAGRRFLAARDAAVAAQGTCSEAGMGAPDFEGDSS